jgi:hypothetical protein
VAQFQSPPRLNPLPADGQSPYYCYKPPLNPLPADGQSPYDCYKLFIDDAFVNGLVRASQQHASHQGRPAAVASQITQDSLLTALGVLHMMGYVQPGRWDLFWSQRADTAKEAVKAAIRQAVLFRSRIFLRRVNGLLYLFPPPLRFCTIPSSPIPFLSKSTKQII